MLKYQNKSERQKSAQIADFCLTKLGNKTHDNDWDMLGSQRMAKPCRLRLKSCTVLVRRDGPDYHIEIASFFTLQPTESVLKSSD